MKIAIIGAGNMGGAVARALAKGEKVKRSDITVSNPSIGKLEALKADFPDIHVTTDNREAYIAGQLIILAVKPWKIQGVLEELKDLFKNSNRMMASMAAGVSTTQIGEWMALPQETLPPIFRIIPNTAIEVGQSMTFISSAHSTTEKDEEVLNIFGECGVAMMVDEAMIASGTALASCGIAYAMRYLRAAMEGGVELGFYPNDAQKIVMQTMKGAVELLQAKGSHPETEIDRVTTPGGITIKGLNAMEEAGFTASVIEGLRASK
jgi:pyrroline-5-carboxylate reductase